MDDARYEREMLEYKVDALLRAKGWKHTCTTPGSLWLWSKTVRWMSRNIIPGTKRFKTTRHAQMVMVDKDTAVSMQWHLDGAAK
jgi:hypothetical protein